MNDLKKTIKHFESLQKRYTTQHNGKMCDRVADALEALRWYSRIIALRDHVVYIEQAKTPSFEVTYAKPIIQSFSLEDEADR